MSNNFTSPNFITKPVPIDENLHNVSGLYVLVNNQWVPVKAKQDGSLISSRAFGGLPYSNDSGLIGTVGIPVIEDINNFLERNAYAGGIKCDGPGDLKIYFSPDGINYSTLITVKDGEVFGFDNLDIDSIKIDATQDGTAYRLQAW